MGVPVEHVAWEDLRQRASIRKSRNIQSSVVRAGPPWTRPTAAASPIRPCLPRSTEAGALRRRARVVAELEPLGGDERAISLKFVRKGYKMDHT